MNGQALHGLRDIPRLKMHFEIVSQDKDHIRFEASMLGTDCGELCMSPGDFHELVNVLDKLSDGIMIVYHDGTTVSAAMARVNRLTFKLADIYGDSKAIAAIGGGNNWRHRQTCAINTENNNADCTCNQTVRGRWSELVTETSKLNKVFSALLEASQMALRIAEGKETADGAACTIVKAAIEQAKTVEREREKTDARDLLQSKLDKEEPIAEVKPPTVVKDSEGKCPKCGSEDGMDDWGAFEHIDSSIGFYPFVCECGASGQEWFKLVYIESVLNE